MTEGLKLCVNRKEPWTCGEAAFCQSCMDAALLQNHEAIEALQDIRRHAETIDASSVLAGRILERLVVAEKCIGKRVQEKQLCGVWVPEMGPCVAEVPCKVHSDKRKCDHRPRFPGAVNCGECGEIIAKQIPDEVPFTSEELQKLKDSPFKGPNTPYPGKPVGQPLIAGGGGVAGKTMGELGLVGEEGKRNCDTCGNPLSAKGICLCKLGSWS